MAQFVGWHGQGSGARDKIGDREASRGGGCPHYMKNLIQNKEVNLDVEEMITSSNVKTFFAAPKPPSSAVGDLFFGKDGGSGTSWQVRASLCRIGDDVSASGRTQGPVAWTATRQPGEECAQSCSGKLLLPRVLSHWSHSDSH